MFESKAVKEYIELRKLGGLAPNKEQKIDILHRIEDLISINIRDKQLMLKICEDNPINFNNLPGLYKKDKNFVFNVFEKASSLVSVDFNKIDKSLHDNKELGLLFINIGGKINSLPKELLSSKEVLLVSLEYSTKTIEYIKEPLLSDIDFAKKALNIDSTYIKVFSESLGNNIEIVKLAINDRISNLQYINKEMLDNDEVCFEALQNNDHEIVLKYFSDRIKEKIKNIGIENYMQENENKSFLHRIKKRLF